MGNAHLRDKAQQKRDRRRIARSRPNCGLCGLPIDYSLKWPDPQCFVLDHIIPINAGGADHISNKQATHAACNSAKRGRLVAPIIKRSAGLNR